MNQRGADAFHFVGTNGCADPTAADSHTPLHFAGDHCFRERDNEVGIVIFKIEAVSPEVRYFMANRTGLRNLLFFQPTPTVVGSDTHLHAASSRLSLPAAVRSASTSAPSGQSRPAGTETLALRSWPRALAFSLPVTTHRICRARLRMG